MSKSFGLLKTQLQILLSEEMVSNCQAAHLLVSIQRLSCMSAVSPAVLSWKFQDGVRFSLIVSPQAS